MRILVVHEVNYLSKIIYEFQILPEVLSILGHSVVIVDYDDSWRTSTGPLLNLRTTVHSNVHRAYEAAAVSVRRPGMIRLPALSRISGSITSALEVNRLLRDSAVDVVLLYGLPTVGLQTILAARRHRVPIVFRSIDVSHELVPYRALVPLTRLLERIVFNRVDFNIALTQHISDYIHSYGVPESKIRLLPSGVDLKMFSPGQRNEAVLAKFKIGPGDPVVLFMGTIYRFSGLDRVIRDFPQLLERHPTAKLLIVGSGEDESRLKSIAAQTRVSASIVFAGLQPYSGLCDIIRSSDICINPFELNGITERILPTKLFQYLACQKPVVATKLPGTLPFLKGEEDGVAYSTLDAFVESVSALLSSCPRRTALGTAGVQAVQQYDWKRIGERMVEWLTPLISQGSGGPISKKQPVPAIDILQEVGRVLDVEIEALKSVRENLPASIVKAVEVIAECTGQVFVTGIGKSGIIGSKIAATLRSTGTSAVFLQASEALHGDVGVLRPEDVVLALGKSGESTELNTLLRALKKAGVPIISITSNGDSSMALLSDIVIDLQITQEACPLNLAPTSSTTAALVIGDAIAVALMKLKNISIEDFARHHPGGQLGRRLLLTVEDVMRGGEQNPVISASSTIREMLAAITTFRVGAICVIDNGQKLLGLVTDYDVRKALETHDTLFSMNITDLMNASPDVVFRTDRAIDALELMRSRTKPTAVLPVLDSSRHVVGMVHLHDLVAAGI